MNDAQIQLTDSQPQGILRSSGSKRVFAGDAASTSSVHWSTGGGDGDAGPRSRRSTHLAAGSATQREGLQLELPRCARQWYANGKRSEKIFRTILPLVFAVRHHQNCLLRANCVSTDLLCTHYVG